MVDGRALVLVPLHLEQILRREEGASVDRLIARPFDRGPDLHGPAGRDALNGHCRTDCCGRTRIEQVACRRDGVGWDERWQVNIRQIHVIATTRILGARPIRRSPRSAVVGALRAHVREVSRSDPRPMGRAMPANV